ncbi:MAG: hypothetical protein ACKOJD_03200, partial [Candidatus Limnocylindrus sp.]
ADRGRGMRALIPWLLGEAPTTTTVAFAALWGLCFAAAISTAAGVSGAMQLGLALLSFDIAAGLVSNLSRSTQRFWRSRGDATRKAYVLLHVALYPIIAVLLVGPGITWLILLVGVAAKVGAFQMRGAHNA